MVYKELTNLHYISTNLQNDFTCQKIPSLYFFSSGGRMHKDFNLQKTKTTNSLNSSWKIYINGCHHSQQTAPKIIADSIPS
jgi:hypothetical protein